MTSLQEFYGSVKAAMAQQRGREINLTEDTLLEMRIMLQSRKKFEDFDHPISNLLSPSPEIIAAFLLKAIPTQPMAQLINHAYLSNDPETLIIVADCFYFGLNGATEDRVRAEELYSKAADLEHPEGMCAAAWICYLSVRKALEPRLPIHEEWRIPDKAKSKPEILYHLREMWEHLENAATAKWCTPILFKQGTDAFETKSWKPSQKVKNMIEARKRDPPRPVSTVTPRRLHKCSNPICDFTTEDISTLKVCGRCKKNYYCSRECQTKHWQRGHRDACNVATISPIPSRVSNGVETIELEPEDEEESDAAIRPNGDSRPASEEEIKSRFLGEMRRRCIEARARLQANSLAEGAETLMDRANKFMVDGQYARATRCWTLMIDNYEVSHADGDFVMEMDYYADLLRRRALCAIRAAESGQAPGLVETVRKDCEFLLYFGTFQLPAAQRQSVLDLENRAKALISASKPRPRFAITEAEEEAEYAEEDGDDVEEEDVEGSDVVSEAKENLVPREVVANAVTDQTVPAEPDDRRNNQTTQSEPAAQPQRRRTRRRRQYRIRYRQRGGDEQEYDEEEDELSKVSILSCQSLVGANQDSGDLCPVCFNEWAEFVDPSLAISLPCSHSLCLRCLLHLKVQTQKPFQTEFHGEVTIDFRCPSCRHDIPSTIVEVVTESIASRPDIVESIYLLGSKLPLDSDGRVALVSSLLVKYDFDVIQVETALFNTIGLMDRRNLAIPLTTAEKQRIYDEARTPVEKLRADYEALQEKFEKLRSSEASTKERKKAFASLQSLRRRLNEAQQNAANDIFA
ncbi:hypothetical protein HDU67_009497, partial [Dinochytrium kinnereticum]